jgi:two-component system, OmpR family, response regulator CpxR
LRPKKVLLCVSSDAQQLSILSFMLSTNGYKVEACDSSAKALLFAQTHDFRVLIVGRKLDSLTGDDLARLINPLAPWSRAIIICKPGEIPDDHFADVWMVEPYITSELLEHVNLMCKRKRGPHKKGNQVCNSHKKLSLAGSVQVPS